MLVTQSVETHFKGQWSAGFYIFFKTVWSLIKALWKTSVDDITIALEHSVLLASILRKWLMWQWIQPGNKNVQKTCYFFSDGSFVSLCSGQIRIPCKFSLLILFSSYNFNVVFESSSGLPTRCALTLKVCFFLSCCQIGLNEMHNFFFLSVEDRSMFLQFDIWDW